ncbi:DUF4238 domain-containing protein [Rhodococcus fascians]|nr:DUF4238 domain-containing protein [Rhodococcus fascians]
MPDLNGLIQAMKFDHEWLSDGFIAESQRLAANENTRHQHYVPQMYLKRWAIDGLLQQVEVDSTRKLPLQPTKEVAKGKNFYTLPSIESTLHLPLKWVETHLGRIESICAEHIETLVKWGSGVVSDATLKRDLSVYLGLQLTRTVASRERTLVLVHGPDAAKRIIWRRLNPSGNAAQLEEAMGKRFADPKQEALDLMVKDVRNVAAEALFQREWAVYRTVSPIPTSDDPVVVLSGPPLTRDVHAGVGYSAAVLFPLDPHHLLVMLKPGLSHRGPYKLKSSEADQVVLEIVGAANLMAIERPGDGVIAQVSVPPRPVQEEMDGDRAGELSKEAAIRLLQDVVPRSRWASAEDQPAWAVQRWYLN